MQNPLAFLLNQSEHPCPNPRKLTVGMDISRRNTDRASIAGALCDHWSDTTRSHGIRYVVEQAMVPNTHCNS
jgi:hypothetical protein